METNSGSHRDSGVMSLTTLTAPCGVCINNRLSEEDLALPHDQRNVSRREIVHKVGDTVKFMVPRLHLRGGGEGEGK